MRFSSLALFVFLATTASAAPSYINHPEHRSLAGMSEEDLAVYERQIRIIGAQPVPPPVDPKLNKYRLVHDRAHPWVKPGRFDQRGPCPASNTMANHGYLPHNGIASPAQIINASMEVFGMGYNLALFTVYAQHLVGGNQLTDLMSIGGYDIRTGLSNPTQSGGYSGHNTFEGDASLSRTDNYVGDSINPNITMINEMIDIMNQYGGGRYNATVAAKTREHVVNFGISHNPKFKYDFPRYLASYGETSFPLAMFSNQSSPTYAEGPNESIIRSFFIDQKMPEKFHRREGGWELTNVGDIFGVMFSTAPTYPGKNDGTNVNSFVMDPKFLDGRLLCDTYRGFANNAFGLYPNPTGALKKALRGNLDNFYVPIKNIDPTCPKVVDPWP